MKNLTNARALAALALLGAAALLVGTGGRADAQASARKPGRYAPVNGLRMYYEIRGTGRPLVLLHGALSNIQTDFGKVIPTLAKTRRVIAIEQQAHGRTSDVDRPLSTEQMADDTAELLRQLGIESADVLGYSMGAGIAMQLAIRHPKLARKLVLLEPAYTRAGFYPEVLEGIQKLKPEDLAGSPFQKAYAAMAPKPENWATLVAKVQKGSWVERDSPLAAIESIKVPALILIGDSDVIRPEHALELFRLLGGGVPGDLAGLPRSQLAVFPGTTHVTLVHRADWLLSMVPAFLDASLPETK
ncbi:MAG: alpha/beta fold hydrolase [Gemmatimonadaceae bacterium]